MIVFLYGSLIGRRFNRNSVLSMPLLKFPIVLKIWIVTEKRGEKNPMKFMVHNLVAYFE